MQSSAQSTTFFKTGTDPYDVSFSLLEWNIMNNKGCVLRPKKGPDIISEISAIRDTNFEEGRHQVPDTP